MKGWILYKRCHNELTDADHGVNRLLAAAAKLDIELEVYKPTQFELIASNDNNRTVILNGQETEVPDFLLPRIGADTTFHALALIRYLEFLGVPLFVQTGELIKVDTRKGEYVSRAKE